MNQINPLPLTDSPIDFKSVFRDYEAAMANAEQHLCDITRWWDDAYLRLQSAPELQGEPMPWEKTTDKFRFRPGELTIWAGVNKNGKSLVVNQCAAWFERPAAIASLEMKPVETISRLMRQVCGVRVPTRAYYDQRLMDLHGKIYLYDKVGRVSPEEVYGLIHYAAVERNCGHIVIDSLVKIAGVAGDYEQQIQVANMLQEMAKDHNVHVHLIHHMRKGANEEDIPDKFSVKGAGELVDLCDNLIIVHRNVRKERLARTNDPAFNPDEPDGYLRVAAQRHGEWDGSFSFWFEPNSLQWISRPNGGPIQWPEIG